MDGNMFIYKPISAILALLIQAILFGDPDTVWRSSCGWVLNLGWLGIDADYPCDVKITLRLLLFYLYFALVLFHEISVAQRCPDAVIVLVAVAGGR